MDPFFLIVLFVLYWVIRNVKAQSRRRGDDTHEPRGPAPAEPTGPRKLDDQVSDWIEEGQRRAIEALRKWEERQRAQAGAAGRPGGGEGVAAGRRSAAGAARPPAAGPPPAIGRPRTPARFEEPPPGWWDAAESEEAESLETIEDEEQAAAREPPPAVPPAGAPARPAGMLPGPGAAGALERSAPRLLDEARLAAGLQRAAEGSVAARKTARAAAGEAMRAELGVAGSRLAALTPLQRAIVLREVFDAPLSQREPGGPHPR